MSEIISEDYDINDRSLVADGLPNEQHYRSPDLIAEWRSSEQAENGIPSTSPSYWDIDDDDSGLKPSELYGRFTWKIESFSTINVKEMRSDVFEVGGCKWYILIHPQGCDVCNHISLFLCVANHDKLLPGWSHFAQFTISVVNKDPKKSKYSDTLHRFSKKEHDWGWKKFVELSKIYDGFIDVDTLVVKAQVQVIREKTDRPFRCLDFQYWRELVRVYFVNVEQICRRSIEEQRDKLKKLVNDKLRWPSFRAFWLGMKATDRSSKIRDKNDVILKALVKYFFIDKEATSTILMDSLYGGLKALECKSKNKERAAKLIELEEFPDPMIYVDKNMFVLADDLVLLLQRASSEPLPPQALLSKDDKSSPSRIKEASLNEVFSKDSIERDERRVMELGRRTVEIFALAHILSKIEISYEEDVAWKRQEELIREEAAGQAENEHKAKRAATEKEKLAKKKQVKQKHVNRKAKIRDEKPDAVSDKLQLESPDDTVLDYLCPKQVESVTVLEKTLESRDGNDVQVLQPYIEDREASPINWGTDVSEIHASAESNGSCLQNGQTETRSQYPMDDSSSRCSTDSVPSDFITVPSTRNALKNKNQPSANRVSKQLTKETQYRTKSVHNRNSQPDVTHNVPSCDVANNTTPHSKSEAVELNLNLKIPRLQKHLNEKNEEVMYLQKLPCKNNVKAEKPSKTMSRPASFNSSPGEAPPYIFQQPKQSAATISRAVSKTRNMAEVASFKELSSSAELQSGKAVNLSLKRSLALSTCGHDAESQIAQAKNCQQATSVSRPSSAMYIPGQRPSVPNVSEVPTTSLLSHSVIAARQGDNLAQPGYVPRSYRNVAAGKTTEVSSIGASTHQAASSGQVMPRLQSPSVGMSSASVLPSQTSIGTDSVVGTEFTFQSVKPESVLDQHSYREKSNKEVTSSNPSYFSDLSSRMEMLNIQGELCQEKILSGDASVLHQCQAQGSITDDEFPHLDIIYDLLDDKQSMGRTSKGFYQNFSWQHSLPPHAYPMDVGSIGRIHQFDQSEQYYDDNLQRAYDGAWMQNGHLLQAMANQWPYGYTDTYLSVPNSGIEDANRYPYQFPNYSSLASQVNGFTYNQ